MASETKFIEPGWFTRNVFNRIVNVAGRLGLSLAGHRTLTVKGRKSGKPLTTPVNPLDFEGETYLVSPRGNHPVGRATCGSSGRASCELGPARPGASAARRWRRARSCRS